MLKNDATEVVKSDQKNKQIAKLTKGEHVTRVFSALGLAVHMLVYIDI